MSELPLRNFSWFMTMLEAAYHQQRLWRFLQAFVSRIFWSALSTSTSTLVAWFQAQRHRLPLPVSPSLDAFLKTVVHRLQAFALRSNTTYQELVTSIETPALLCV